MKENKTTLKKHQLAKRILSLSLLALLLIIIIILAVDYLDHIQTCKRAGYQPPSGLYSDVEIEEGHRRCHQVYYENNITKTQVVAVQTKTLLGRLHGALLGGEDGEKTDHGR